MATKTVVTLVDDIDGSDAAQTVEIALDGDSYELDLSTAHRHELVRSLARYMAVARRVGGAAQAPTPTFVSTQVDPQAVRAWARANGIEVPPGRRVPKDIVERFRAAGN